MAKFERENADLRRSKNVSYRGAFVSHGAASGSYGGASRGPKDFERKEYGEMTGNEKVKATCSDYNTNNGCNKNEMYGFCGNGANKLKHACNKILEGDRICWRKHSVINHV